MKLALQMLAAAVAATAFLWTLSVLMVPACQVRMRAPAPLSKPSVYRSIVTVTIAAEPGVY